MFLTPRKEQPLKIKDSAIQQTDKGRFAFDKSESANEIIVRAGDTISKYIGQIITHNERRERFGNKTALYAVEVGSRVIDARSSEKRCWLYCKYKPEWEPRYHLCLY